MRGKFKNALGPSQDTWEKETGFKRSFFDTEHEQQAVTKRDQDRDLWGKAQVHDGSDGLGFIDRMEAVTTCDVMERAMADRLAEAEREEAEWGDTGEARAREAREEEEDQHAGGANEEDELEALRARRRQQMKDKQNKKKEYEMKGHGVYDEIVEEDFLKTVTGSYRAVVHFYSQRFEKCKIMDMHLRKMAIHPKFLGTRFVKMDAEKAPFFVSKLRIQTLPSVCLFIDGVLKHKHLGFDSLPGAEECKTVDLVCALREHEIFEDYPDSDMEF